MTVWYIMFSFGTFFLLLVSCTKKNLATLLGIWAQFKHPLVCVKRPKVEGGWPR
jgi:hypothetical protein